jgi:hypothetical protein
MLDGLAMGTDQVDVVEAHLRPSGKPNDRTGVQLGQKNVQTSNVVHAA